MASTISAGTTSGTAIAIAGDTTGNLAFTTQAGTYTQTVPNATGTVMVSGNMPAFSAYPSTTQAISGNTLTKIIFDTEEFDTNNNFASSRFTPTVAGYYMITNVIGLTGSTARIYTTIYKNGALAKMGVDIVYGSSLGATVTALIYCNGSTDYLEIYANPVSNSTTVNSGAGANGTFFQGFLARAA
jgi:hypothetical protein